MQHACHMLLLWDKEAGEDAVWASPVCQSLHPPACVPGRRLNSFPNRRAHALDFHFRHVECAELIAIIKQAFIHLRLGLLNGYCYCLQSYNTQAVIQWLVFYACFFWQTHSNVFMAVIYTAKYTAWLAGTPGDYLQLSRQLTCRLMYWFALVLNTCQTSVVLLNITLTLI